MRDLSRVPTVEAPDAIAAALERRADRIADFRAASADVTSASAGVDEATRLDLRFDRSGATWSVSASSLVDMAAAGAMGINPAATEPLHLDHTGHPAADRFTLAHASKSHVHALGLDWDDVSGMNNGQYAPFSWRSA